QGVAHQEQPAINTANKRIREKPPTSSKPTANRPTKKRKTFTTSQNDETREYEPTAYNKIVHDEDLKKFKLSMRQHVSRKEISECWESKPNLQAWIMGKPVIFINGTKEKIKVIPSSEQIELFTLVLGSRRQSLVNDIWEN